MQGRSTDDGTSRGMSRAEATYTFLCVLFGVVLRLFASRLGALAERLGPRGQQLLLRVGRRSSFICDW